jgi:hypothetical protein
MSSAVKAVEQDGAEAIIFGCTGLLGCADAVRQGLLPRGIDVPVIDPIPTAVSVAAAIARVGLAPSKLTYPMPPQAAHRLSGRSAARGHRGGMTLHGTRTRKGDMPMAVGGALSLMQARGAPATWRRIARVGGSRPKLWWLATPALLLFIVFFVVPVGSLFSMLRVDDNSSNCANARGYACQHLRQYPGHSRQGRIGKRPAAPRIGRLLKPGSWARSRVTFSRRVRRSIALASARTTLAG